MNLLQAFTAFAGILAVLALLGVGWAAGGTWWDRKHSPVSGPASGYIPELPQSDPTVRRSLNLKETK